jgi:hypothetical protein
MFSDFILLRIAYSDYAVFFFFFLVGRLRIIFLTKSKHYKHIAAKAVNSNKNTGLTKNRNKAPTQSVFVGNVRTLFLLYVVWICRIESFSSSIKNVIPQKTKTILNIRT